MPGPENPSGTGSASGAGSTGEAPGARIHSDRRLPALTGLRIFAAVAVYFNHIGNPEGTGGVIRSFVYSGYCGVTIFFVLSGFVLAYNYFDSLRQQPSVGKVYDYFVARFARVYPLYFLVLLYLFLELHAAGGSTSGWWRNALVVQAWDPNLLQAFSFNAPSWSVSVEFFLYACFPLLIPLVAWLRSPRSLLIAGGVVAGAVAALAAWFVATGKGDLSFLDPNSAHRWLYRTPLTRLGDFMLGMLAARLFVLAGHLPWARSAGRWLTPLAAVAILALMAWPALLITAWSWDVAYAVPGVILIFGLAVAPRTILARFLSLPAIVLLGEASYAFYLVHFPAIGLFHAGLWQVDASVSRILFEALTLGAIMAFSVGLHIGFELPARKRLRAWLSSRGKLASLLRRRQKAPASAGG